MSQLSGELKDLILAAAKELSATSYMPSRLKDTINIKDVYTGRLVGVSEVNTKQPYAIPNDEVHVWDLVKVDMAERDAMGAIKHKTRLQPYNGRDCLVDAYQEALDMIVYLRQAIYERDGK